MRRPLGIFSYMAQRRMFSLKIVSSDSFLDMPVSARELYFQLGMYADDDGFINPKKIVRMTGASDDDLKLLIAKRFVLPFQNGVVVIKHWLINNLIRKDFYQPTTYIEEKNILKIKENKAYTDNVNNLSPQVRLGKVRLGKDRLEDTCVGFENFWKEYPKKIGKKTTEASFRKIKPELHDSLMAGLSKWKQSDQWTKDGGQFIPYPATWLNQERWNDEVPVKVKTNNIIVIGKKQHG